MFPNSDNLFSILFMHEAKHGLHGVHGLYWGSSTFLFVGHDCLSERLGFWKKAGVITETNVDCSSPEKRIKSI